MRKLIIVVFLLLLAGLSFKFYRDSSSHNDVHLHAGFHVYVDEKLQDFKDFKFMHEKPCTVNGKPIPDEHEDEQIEKAHLHDQIGDVVHVHRKDAKWGDLFNNIKYPIDEKAVAYINGERVDEFLDESIQPYDSLVVFVGKHSNDKKYLKDAVTPEYVKKIEKKSENCSS